ncbi:MAG TPA: hypothetical protein V6D11_22095 [Waterburya sp.]|jgi:hypothetical protein
MNIDPGIKVEKTEVINKLIEEVYLFVEELEQQVRRDLYGLKQGIETENTPTMEVKHSVETD